MSIKRMAAALSVVIGLTFLAACGSEAAKEKADTQAEVSTGEEMSGENSVESEAQEMSSDKEGTDEGYGRMLFIGDSRTVDIFTETDDRIMGDVHDNIIVYCVDGAQFKFMTDSIDTCGLDNFDTLVSWMGCNEFGDFSQYGPYYDELLEKGKKIIVCTVGPTKDECLLNDVDYLYYPNANQIRYNNSLKEWAEGAGVRVIDLYTYIDSVDTIYQDPMDGIHYFPKPNPELWNHILKELIE